MSIEHEKKILEILDEVLELPPRERQTFLDKACGDDQTLRQDVEALIETEIDSGPLAEPAFNIHAEDVGIGRRIGRYTLVRLLDRGGMGSVYLAEREDFEQQVALKLIRRGLDADPMLVRRFENERQILARLQHRHIAGLLDGGTTADRLPYFVMEYVEGERIDRYGKTRKLSIEERLALFRKVCSAVQFAHQNLVIHRDLKPANILITEDGQPKLLDFGIAKLLDDSMAAKAVDTVLGQGAMTPRYASPEQIRFKQVTTTSDVYSLGVLLYELLTGLDPYSVDSRRQDEVARAVCEQDPDRPSTAVRRRSVDPEAIETQKLRRQLSGDLDSIVLKAMRKEPEQRYASAEQLSEDIGRYLEGLPVEAQTGTFTYRAGKFVRRHRLGMGVAAAFLFLIISFSVTSTVLWQVAERESQKASWMQTILEEFLEAADPDQTGSRDTTVLEALQRGQEKALQYLDSTEAGLRIYLAGRLGNILLKSGAYDESKAMMQESWQAARIKHGEVHPEVARRLNNLAVLLFELEDYREAEQRFREILNIREELDQTPQQRFKTRSNLAMTLLRQGKLDEAEELCAEVLAARLRLYKDEPDDLDVATSKHNLAAVYYAQGHFKDAEVLLREALEARRRRSATPNNTLIATTLDLLGRVIATQGRTEEAEGMYLEALKMREALLPPFHRDLARTRIHLALLLAQNDPEIARTHINDVLPIFTSFRPNGWDASEARNIIGMIRAIQGNFEQAEPLLTTSYERMVDLRGSETYRSRLALQRIIDLYTNWGENFEELKRYQGIADALSN